jgi:hypothetical protein
MKDVGEKDTEDSDQEQAIDVQRERISVFDNDDNKVWR